MSFEQKSEDLIEEFEIHYQNIKGEKHATRVREELRRGLPGFIKGIKLYLENKPYVSSFDISDICNELSESKQQIGGDIGLQPYINFLEFVGYDGIFDDSILGDRYGLDREMFNQERNSIDKLIDEIELKEPIHLEAKVAEYVVADLYRNNGEAPTRTEVKLGMEKRLGYELSEDQVEHRITKNGYIEPNGTGGRVENSFSFQR